MGVETRAEDENVELQRVYFVDDDSLQQFLAWHQRQKHAGVITAAGSVEYADWESFLHGGFEPFTVGNLFVIPAENPPPVPEGRRPLRVIPGRGFGTGSHPTTRLTMDFLSEFWQPGDALDVGTGSGILAVQAALMGSSKVIAVDTDGDSIENAQENIAINESSSTIDVRHGSIDQVEEESFSLVLANIISPVLETLIRSGLVTKGVPGCRFIFSGILETELESFSRLLIDHGLVIKQQAGRKEWRALVAEKP